jgi:diguanylate cyclase (GGDEF)-like protein/PAS domain S-box-containing protein
MRLKLSTRIISLVVVLQAVMMFLLIWNSTRLMDRGHAEIFQHAVWSKGLLLANALAPGLAYDDPATLQDVFALARRDSNLVFADVHNRDGISLAGFGKNRDFATPDNSYQDALRDGIYDVVLDVSLAGQSLGTLHMGYSVHDAARLNAETRFQNTLIALLGLGVTLVATVLLVMLLTRNLRRLEAGAQALARDQLDYRIQVDSSDEIGDLAQSFNHLAQHLSETQAALQGKHLALKRETRFLQTLLDGIDAVIMEARPPACQFSYVSREAENLLGYPMEDWLQPGFWMRHVFPEDRGWLEDTFAKHVKNGESFKADFRMTHQQGHVLWVRAINNVELSGDGDPIVRGLLLDITEHKTAEDRILYLAEHDPLTGLINRHRFQRELERAISYSQRYEQTGAVLFVDLDQFKYVNDTYGHQYGDEYLLDISRRLSRVLRRTDILGRLGGDEFGVIIPKTTDAEAYTIGMSLLGALAQENLELDGRSVPASASIGVALFPNQSAVPSDLLAKADAAMYTAKHKGRSQVHIYSDNDNELWNMQAKIHWEERIRWALSDDRFQLFYQPVVDLRSGLITHYEVLLRMIGENGELITPAAFIETAERFGLIREIDKWVVQAAIARQGNSVAEAQPVSLAINLSGRHFNSQDMLQLVQESIDKYGADAGSLMFEVTETEAVENLHQAREFINALRKLGCRFALDDFGIGFSSFQYLRNLPVDYVKIDGSFVRNLHVDADDRIFVKAIVELAQGLGIPCIAEFVENGHIVEVLKKLGVNLGQGYHLARPQPELLENPILDL